MTAEQKEKEIQKNMRVLKISRAEAEQLFEDDYSENVLPEVAEMERKAKNLGRRYEGDTKAKKKSSRERKVDTEKQKILEIIKQPLKIIGKKLTIINETEISFYVGENHYSLKLIKHRNKK